MDYNRVGAALGDLDGDGDLDILDLGSGSGASVHFNQGDGSFISSETNYNIPRAVNGTLADVDGDGNLDLIAVSDRHFNSKWYIFSDILSVVWFRRWNFW